MLTEGQRTYLELCAAVADNTTAMLAYWDKQLICRFANKAYQYWFGTSPADMIDKITLEQLLGPLYKFNLPYVHGVMQGMRQEFEREITLPGGEVRHAMATYTPNIVNNVVEGFYVHVADITNAKNIVHAGGKKPVPGSNAAQAHAARSLEGVVQTLHASVLTGFPGIGKLAAMHFVSESKLKRDFKVVYGTTIFSFFRSLQMEWAYNELKQKKYSNKQMAAILQFANASNFSAGYRKYVKDRQAKSAIDNLITANDERYKTFIAQAPFAIAMLDDELKYLAASQKYVQDNNLGGIVLEGNSWATIFTEYKHKWRPIYAACLQGQVKNGEDEIVENGKVARYIKWDVRPWYKNNDIIGGILIFTEDITSEKLKEAENKKIFEILDKANEIARIGTWKRDFNTGTGQWSRVTKEILEVPDDFIGGIEDGLKFYREGKSRDQVISEVRKALTKGKPFDIEVEIITARGNVKLVRLVGYPEFVDGACEKLFGILQDITHYAQTKA